MKHNSEQLIHLLAAELAERLETMTHITPRAAHLPDTANKIKVIIGMRRAGKTTFAYQHIKKLLAAGISMERILYVNFEDDRLLPLTQDKLVSLVEAFYATTPGNHDRQCFLILDEIQNVSGWQIVVRRLFDTKSLDIVLTGSSANLLSKEIASNLRGRSLSTEIWPYSFTEFLAARQKLIQKAPFGEKAKNQLTELFKQYLQTGGFPEVIHYSDNIRLQTLQEYLDVTIYRDIIERYQIKNTSLIKYLILFLVNNAAGSFSVNKFYQDAKTQGYRVSREAIYDYIQHIEDAYLCFCVDLYDRSIRKVQTNPKKIYAIDTGLLNALKLSFDSDSGKQFENVVYLDLRRQRCDVYYYLTEERYEVDFLAINSQGKKKLFQVVWDISNEQTYQREQRALEKAKVELNIPGSIITLESYLKDGIQFD